MAGNDPINPYEYMGVLFLYRHLAEWMLEDLLRKADTPEERDQICDDYRQAAKDCADSGTGFVVSELPKQWQTDIDAVKIGMANGLEKGRQEFEIYLLSARKKF